MTMLRWMILIPACMAATPAAAGTLSYDCDTGANRFSEITTPLAGDVRISGVVTPLRMTVGDGYVTAARVAIEEGEGKSWVGFRLFRVDPADPDTLVALMVASDGDKEKETILGRVKLSQALSFRLSLGKDRTASLELGEWKHVVATTLKAPVKASVACSTGEFDFDPLDFGR